MQDLRWVLIIASEIPRWRQQLFISLSACVSARLPACVSARLSVHLPVCLPVWLPLYLPVHLPISASLLHACDA